MMLFVLTKRKGGTFVDQQISGAIKTVIATVRNIANPIAVLSPVLMGVYLLLGSDQQTLSKVKRWAISVIIGIVLINMAEPIVNWLQTIK
jgi:type IV secretory pathway VirB2 component (pilin)